MAGAPDGAGVSAIGAAEHDAHAGFGKSGSLEKNKNENSHAMRSGEHPAVADEHAAAAGANLVIESSKITTSFFISTSLFAFSITISATLT